MHKYRHRAFQANQMTMTYYTAGPRTTSSKYVFYTNRLIKGINYGTWAEILSVTPHFQYSCNAENHRAINICPMYMQTHNVWRLCMNYMFFLLIFYIAIATFVLQKVLGLAQVSDAIFPGIAAGILLTVIHKTVKRKLKER